MTISFYETEVVKCLMKRSDNLRNEINSTKKQIEILSFKLDYLKVLLLCNEEDIQNEVEKLFNK